MEHNEMEFKMKSTSWQGCNLWENNAVEFFDLTPEHNGSVGVGIVHVRRVIG
jgi:hypothetical protein